MASVRHLKPDVRISRTRLSVKVGPRWVRNALRATNCHEGSRILRWTSSTTQKNLFWFGTSSSRTNLSGTSRPKFCRNGPFAEGRDVLAQKIIDLKDF